MQLRIASDFHLEFYTYNTYKVQPGKDINENIVLPEGENEKEQILLLAGDILMALHCDKYVVMFDMLSKRFKHIYVIMGNHEHYVYNFNRSLTTLKTFYNRWKNITLLEKDIVFLDDETALYAATLWTDMDRNNPQTKLAALGGMPDFKTVMYGAADDPFPFGKFTPELSIEEHKIAMNALNDFVKLPHKKKIIMTHHAPSGQSTAERFKGDPMNGAFSSNLENFIVDNNPTLWIHGHMHNNSDYMINNTRVICNPYGYYGENPSYKGNFIVDI